MASALVTKLLNCHNINYLNFGKRPCIVLGTTRNHERHSPKPCMGKLSPAVRDMNKMTADVPTFSTGRMQLLRSR